ncbi:hypothetical protein BUY89_11675 [Staphylococcus equorum]|nr:hypothetical protein BUY89_11675 [Staphylococcus equorum]
MGIILSILSVVILVLICLSIQIGYGLIRIKNSKKTKKEMKIDKKHLTLSTILYIVLCTILIITINNNYY